MSTIKLKPRDKSIEKLEKLPDRLKPIGQRTRSRRAALGDAKALDAAIKAAELAKKQTPGNTIKLRPLQMNPILEKDYKQGMRKKSSEKRKSRSRSKSNSSNVVVEESMSNGSSAMIENEFETPKVENIEKPSKNSFLPPLMNDSSKRGKTLVQMLKPNMMKRAGVPNMGGKRKTAKRRRAKKSCGWFW
jgi:hypothetical protein